MDRTMAEDGQTHFHFDFGGIILEVSGDREFVQEMYRCVMEDVKEARAKANRAIAQGVSDAALSQKQGLANTPSVWLHRCSDMMRKVYMASRGDVEESPLSGVLDVSKVSNIHLDKGVFEAFFPDLDGGHTLWAEFTAAGRKKIAEATRPMRALQVPKK